MAGGGGRGVEGRGGGGALITSSWQTGCTLYRPPVTYPFFVSVISEVGVRWERGVGGGGGRRVRTSD